MCKPLHHFPAAFVCNHVHLHWPHRKVSSWHSIVAPCCRHAEQLLQGCKQSAILAVHLNLACVTLCKILALPAGFDSQEWYKQLFEYGLNGDNSTSGNGSDPDEELVPRLVGQLVLPLAAHSLQHAWNPHSRRSTASAKTMLEDLLIYVPPEEPKLQVRSTPFGHGRVSASLAFA